jgi:hypothetical protein
VFGKDALDCVPNCPLVFEDPIEAVKETVEEIKEEEKVDMIVCVSHSGTWDDAGKSEDELLAKSVPELDLIISGHTHTKLEKPIQHGDTYIVSASEYGKYLGDMTMSQTPKGRWKVDHYELVPVTQDIREDANTQAKVDVFMNAVDEKYLSKFGYTKDQVLCTNEINFTNYAFVDGAKFKSFEETEHEYLVTFEWSGYVRIPLNLEGKYYSKTMDEKYKNNERKEVAPEMVNVERKAYCSVCGAEMSVYDADIQRADGRDPVCKNCLEKALNSK